MPNQKTDAKGYTAENQDKERDHAAKGGPATGLGNPDNHHGISSPYDADIQTQLAAKSTENNKNKEKDESGCDTIIVTETKNSNAV